MTDTKIFKNNNIQCLQEYWKVKRGKKKPPETYIPGEIYAKVVQDVKYNFKLKNNTHNPFTEK